MDLREIGWGSEDWIQLAQDRDRWRWWTSGFWRHGVSLAILQCNWWSCLRTILWRANRLLPLPCPSPTTGHETYKFLFLGPLAFSWVYFFEYAVWLSTSRQHEQASKLSNCIVKTSGDNAYL
jgi:hypothetical protein